MAVCTRRTIESLEDDDIQQQWAGLLRESRNLKSRGSTKRQQDSQQPTGRRPCLVPILATPQNRAPTTQRNRKVPEAKKQNTTRPPSKKAEVTPCTTSPKGRMQTETQSTSKQIAGTALTFSPCSTCSELLGHLLIRTRNGGRVVRPWHRRRRCRPCHSRLGKAARAVEADEPGRRGHPLVVLIRRPCSRKSASDRRVNAGAKEARQPRVEAKRNKRKTRGAANGGYSSVRFPGAVRLLAVVHNHNNSTKKKHGPRQPPLFPSVLHTRQHSSAQGCIPTQKNTRPRLPGVLSSRTEYSGGRHLPRFPGSIGRSARGSSGRLVGIAFQRPFLFPDARGGGAVGGGRTKGRALRPRRGRWGHACRQRRGPGNLPRRIVRYRAPEHVRLISGREGRGGERRRREGKGLGECSKKVAAVRTPRAAGYVWQTCSVPCSR